jgi:hypothetical protein
VDSRNVIGLAVGLWLGFIWVVWGFGDAVLVALAGAIGYAIAKVLSGDIDLQAALRRLSERR